MSWLSRLKPKNNDAKASGSNESIALPPGCEPVKDNTKLPGEAGYTVTHKRTGLKLVWVPGTSGLSGRAVQDGCFLMGSTLQEIVIQWEDNDWTWKAPADLEQPKHPVELSPFWIGRSEVTNTIFQRFVRQSHYKVEGTWGDYFFGGHGEHPVVGVTWNDARAFCTWAGLGLPAEAQWEWAGRGPEGYAYPWGDDWNRLWCNSLELHAGSLPTPEEFDNYIRQRNILAEKSGLRGNALAITDAVKYLRPVGSVPQDVSWCGAMDMAGNAQEWCSDYFDGRYYQVSAGMNPQGPEKGFDRAWRGGCWTKVAYFSRCSGRGMSFPQDKSGARGFRACLRAE
jgi:formylglycine-generating enzyme